MPKTPIVKHKNLIQILENFGFFKDRQKGSHLIMKHSNGRRVVIPIHPGKDIPRGTLKAILEDADITVGQLVNVL